MLLKSSFGENDHVCTNFLSLMETFHSEPWMKQSGDCEYEKKCLLRAMNFLTKPSSRRVDNSFVNLKTGHQLRARHTTLGHHENVQDSSLIRIIICINVMAIHLNMQTSILDARQVSKSPKILEHITIGTACVCTSNREILFYICQNIVYMEKKPVWIKVIDHWTLSALLLFLLRPKMCEQIQ